MAGAEPSMLSGKPRGRGEPRADEDLRPEQRSDFLALRFGAHDRDFRETHFGIVPQGKQNGLGERQAADITSGGLRALLGQKQSRS